ncbi:hypothetical protein R3P38DRAFT_3202877 [Favolaschia claudopus]|uniref:Uncharacterized protein n=1 Tax=Favolaschia claudopus TaxID=2862362 RepID=A0AAW0AUI7_9AGAR
MDVLGTYSGGGSCGIAATNFVELRAGLPIPRWQAEQSSLFRDLILQDLLLYHLIARGKTTTYSDWVVPCTHILNGEVSLFTDVAVGYNDFNLNQLAPNHPIFDWIQSTAQQPAAFGPHTDVFASEPERSLAVNPKTCSNSNSSSTTDQSANSHVPLPQHDLPIRNHVGHYSRLAEDSASRLKQEAVVDLCSPDVIDLCTPEGTPIRAPPSRVPLISSPHSAAALS